MRALQILAGSIAGRPVEVAAAPPGERGCTDGQTIYVDMELDDRGRRRQLGVQASLLAAGSLGAEVVASLGRDRSLAQRYLAAEGHRALAANQEGLPPWMRSMIDRDLAERLRSPSDSLQLARLDRSLEPDRDLGAIDVRRLSRRPHGAVADASFRAEVADLAVLDDEDGRADDAADVADLFTSPVGGGGPLGRMLARLMRPVRARQGAGPVGVDAPTHVARRSAAGRAVVSPVASALVFEGEQPTHRVTHVYPEWDDHDRAYRDDWCHVIEDVGDVGSGSSTSVPDGTALRRALARLGTGLTPCRRRRQGEDIDIDAVVEARVGLMTGTSHTDDVYIESLRRRRDLSVLVLLDVSGSAAEPGVAGRTVHEHQREAAGLLTATLHGLGDRVALYAFRSSGRKAVRVTKVKGFGDHLDGRACRRLDALRPHAFTRLGAAIRHGAAVLEAQGGTPRRLLVVLSDGLAYDHGYEGRYGEADAQRALLEARQRGIGCLCVSVGADADLAALRRVFGASAHAALPSASDLAASVGPLFAGALR